MAAPKNPGWWVVMIEGEDFPALVGPYRSGDTAETTARKWNDTHRPEDGRAWARPLLPNLSEVN